MELRINKSLVTHIKICDQKNTGKIWCEEKVVKSFFKLFTVERYPAGFYFEGRQDDWNYYGYYSKEDVEECVDFTHDNTHVFRKPKAEIFAGKENLKTKYFETIEEARKYCTDNFPNVKQV